MSDLWVGPLTSLIILVLGSGLQRAIVSRRAKSLRSQYEATLDQSTGGIENPTLATRIIEASLNDDLDRQQLLIVLISTVPSFLVIFSATPLLGGILTLLFLCLAVTLTVFALSDKQPPRWLLRPVPRTSLSWLFVLSAGILILGVAVGVGVAGAGG